MGLFDRKSTSKNETNVSIDQSNEQRDERIAAEGNVNRYQLSGGSSVTITDSAAANELLGRTINGVQQLAANAQQTAADAVAGATRNQAPREIPALAIVAALVGAVLLFKGK
jgi:hypothetical protein